MPVFGSCWYPIVLLVGTLGPKLGMGTRCPFFVEVLDILERGWRQHTQREKGACLTCEKKKKKGRI